MARYIYKGPFQARSITQDGKIVFDGNLVTGKTYAKLPEAHPEIVAMIAGGLLVPVDEPAPANDSKKKETK